MVLPGRSDISQADAGPCWQQLSAVLVAQLLMSEWHGIEFHVLELPTAMQVF